jgi:type IV pilus assembly protein PilA
MKVAPKGFTLIELMIVVAIVGILIVAAVPFYQDYAKRSRVSEALSLAAGAKTSVVEFYFSNSQWPTGAPDGNAAAGLAPMETIIGNSVAGVAVDGSAIGVQMNATFDPNPYWLGLKATDSNGSITWSCKHVAAAGIAPPAAMQGSEIPAKWRPPECR